MSRPVPSRVAALLRSLPPKEKQPNSKNVLDAWIAQASNRLGPDAEAGRLGWLVASSVAIAAVQRAVDAEGRQLFLLKGGTLLQHRLNSPSRTTSDVDGLIRGDIDAFLAALDTVLAEPWGPLTLRHGPAQVIEVASRVLKPRRFDIYLELRGVTWRRIQFEFAPDEACIGDESESVEPPPLGGFGLPDPSVLVGIAIRHQIAQKLHAVSDPHDPPRWVNDRPRDVVDLLLLRDLAASTGRPSAPEIADAARAVFLSRAAEAAQLGRAPRSWPPMVVAHPHWANDFRHAAESADFRLSLDDAVSELNAWIELLSRA